MTNLIGQSIGRYHILEQLGEGGMATVYKAFDTRLERDVAIKVIRRSAFPPEQLERILKRFEREAKALARLSHPNILKVLDYGEHEGSPYLVLEYLPGGTLKQRMGQPTGWQDALTLMLPVVDALAYAHEHKIIHRDIKPSNILLTEKGQPMLTDFGIAKILDLEDGQTLTGTGVGIGTPEYMAPEQGMGKEIDARADVYSLGIVLYELLTGRKPYTADTPMAVVFKHITDPLPRPTQFTPGLPEEIEKVLLKALAKQPEDRYPDMETLAPAMRALLNTGAALTQVSQPTPSETTTRSDLYQANLDDAPTRDETPLLTPKPRPPAPLPRPIIPRPWWQNRWLWAGTGLLTLVAIFGIFSNPPLTNTANPPPTNTANPPPTNTATPATSQMPQDTPTTITQPDEKIQVRWFVGLGAGSDEDTFAGQQAVVDEFNASQDRIELVLEIVDNYAAYDTLATRIATGNAPDIVGPVGIRGRDSFKGAWLDLQPFIKKTDYDLSDFSPAMVELYQVKEEGQLGIPFAIFPSFIIFNKDLFNKAGLPYPPAKYGQPYVDENGVSKEWNMDTLREVAIKLTLDANGRNAASSNFNSSRIVQFGFMNQWTDARGIGTFFGAGSLVDDNGNAQIPANWQAAWEWTYKGWWEDYFIPNAPYEGADFLQGPAGPFSSGNLAIVHLHLWYVAPWALGDVDWEWDLAATPSYNGVVTSKMHADTFGILKGSKNPDAAFEVLTYLLGAETSSKLLNVYGGIMPARLSLQDRYFDTYGKSNFPGKNVNWGVVVASITYADNPNHEAYIPNLQKTTDRYNEYWNFLANTPGANFKAETNKLLVDLQKIFDAAK